MTKHLTLVPPLREYLDNLTCDVDSSGIPVRPSIERLKEGMGAHAAAFWIEYLEAQIVDLLQERTFPHPRISSVPDRVRVKVESMAGMDVGFVEVAADDPRCDGSEFDGVFLDE